jgi:hypothetical protein
MKFQKSVESSPLFGRGHMKNELGECRRETQRANRRLEFKLSIGFVHPGGFMLAWFMGQMMEQGLRRLGCAFTEKARH